MISISYTELTERYDYESLKYELNNFNKGRNKKNLFYVYFKTNPTSPLLAVPRNLKKLKFDTWEEGELIQEFFNFIKETHPRFTF